MLIDVLRNKLIEAAPVDEIERDNVVQELLQHFVLLGLSRSGFFEKAAFHGGTCLRVVNGINRFFEDLDFMLKTPDDSFAWQEHLAAVVKDCATEGIAMEIQDRAKADTAVRKAFLKNDSVGKVLTLRSIVSKGPPRKHRIKLEIATNPPAGSAFETKYITFPTIAPLTVQTLDSSFALKMHALLCRQYVKGRDWFDFIWYASRKTPVNFPLLANALRQQGQWSGQDLPVDATWVRAALDAKIREIDWEVARQDVQRFLPHSEQENLRFWSPELFCQLVANVQ
ncbi:MAG: nucleotidyl transferase AbiEii/AbiGii toxin family protein [Puniceicoccales bacterium]|jgi:predicted nucleotidyltransferase component of viral defense system|nr:nucleotidyl transferase AbiEii/AbiGii toxin family protein [Puniceicoccales bacterium]